MTTGGESRPALRRLGGRGRGRRRGRAAPARPGHAAGRLGRADPGRHRAAHPAVRHRRRSTRPRAPARLARSQRQIMAAGRFGIPALVHEECLTGLAAWQATVFPSPLCWGATLRPGLVERMGAQIGATMRRLGVHQGLAPGPRRGARPALGPGRGDDRRGPATWSARSAAAYVRGLESAGVVATLKHFVGYSASRGGRNLAPVSIGPRELADVLLPPFEMALRAGARSVMNSYTDLDGVPAAADAEPADRPAARDLRLHRHGGLRLLRGRVPADPARRGRRPGPRPPAWRCAAGIDVELPTVNCYGEPLRRGASSAATIDDGAGRPGRCARVLRQKCELGLLDPDWSPEPAGGRDADAIDARRRRVRAPLAARAGPTRSIVLLANDGHRCRWPRASGSRSSGRAPTTPSAMLGCYSFPLHVGVHHPGVPMGDRGADGARGAARRPGRVRGRATRKAARCWAATTPGIAEAAAAAAPTRRLRRGPRRPGRPVRRGVPRARAATPPTCGCPAARRNCSRRCWPPARRWCWCCWSAGRTSCPGRPTGWPPRCAASSPARKVRPALADVLTGRVNPSGRLPVSFPARGRDPARHLPRGPAGPAQRVSTVDPTPLFPFGHGLSYAPVTWAGVRSCSPAAVADRRQLPGRR